MARITVLAGTNGAGKSSIGGAALRGAGSTYYNPVEAARQIRSANSGMDNATANDIAWREGVRQLEVAITAHHDYAFETTLGGRTITKLLMSAAEAGADIWMWYAGLDSPEHHLARVRARVASGGHDIPEEKIRARYNASRTNLIQLMPHLTILRVFDNNTEADPHAGKVPTPRLILSVDAGRITYPIDAQTMSTTPEWAKPIVARAFGR